MGKHQTQRVGDDPEDSSEENEEEDSDDVPEDDFEAEDVESNNEDNSEDENMSDDNESASEGNIEDNDESSEGDAANEESDEEEEAEEEEDEEGNTGWADAMAKVLAMGKNSDKPVSVLSKAKKDNEKKRKVPTEKKPGDESSSDEEESQERHLEPLAVRKARKREIDSIGRKMPNVLERNVEKALARTATRGVVQLFNAVRDHQKDMKTKLKEAGGSFRKQEKVFKNMDKSSFVQMLTGKPISNSSEPPAKKSKTEVKDEEAQDDPSAPSWGILRDDYMLGAKMKDWDKQSDDEQ